MRFGKKIFFMFKVTLALIVATLVLSNIAVDLVSMKSVYDDVEAIPYHKVGLVLGTTKYVGAGALNPYYVYRINAAEELYRNNKVDYLIVSGDNGQMEYNEPILMRNDLIEKGIPEDKIYLDYAGFRTLDSIVRSKEIFSQDSITVISQEFHNKRAIFIGMVKGVEAVGYNAKDVDYQVGFKTNVREAFARVKMMLDLLVNKQPKFLGDKIDIE